MAAFAGSDGILRISGGLPLHTLWVAHLLSDVSSKSFDSAVLTVQKFWRFEVDCSGDLALRAAVMRVCL